MNGFSPARRASIHSGASEVSFGRLDTTKTKGHTSDRGKEIPIDSSAFPMVNPNQNTGNPVAIDTEWKTANQTIFHDRERPSHVLLPILPGEC